MYWQTRPIRPSSLETPNGFVTNKRYNITNRSRRISSSTIVAARLPEAFYKSRTTGKSLYARKILLPFGARQKGIKGFRFVRLQPHLIELTSRIRSDRVTREFEEFAEQASVSNEETGLDAGVVWYSYRDDGPAGSYEAYLPAGLHIGCGVAHIRTFSKDLGGFRACGPVANVLYVPEDGIGFSTELFAGAVSSFGYYVPVDAAHDSELVANIVRTVKNKPLVPLTGRTLRAVRRLVSTVGDEFVGKSREVMYQSRAMEMCALVTTELGRDPSRVRLNRVHKKMHDVRDCIEANLSSDVTLDDLARRNGISTRVLTSAFRDMFGESVHVLITRRRLEEAAVLIEAGASVASAAVSVGYTPNALSTAFARHFGYPPSQLLNHKRRLA